MAHIDPAIVQTKQGINHVRNLMVDEREKPAKAGSDKWMNQDVCVNYIPLRCQPPPSMDVYFGRGSGFGEAREKVYVETRKTREKGGVYVCICGSKATVIHALITRRVLC